MKPLVAFFFFFPVLADELVVDQVQSFGCSRMFNDSLKVLNQKSTNQDLIISNETVEEAQFLATCTFEENTRWGKDVRFNSFFMHTRNQIFNFMRTNLYKKDFKCRMTNLITMYFQTLKNEPLKQILTNVWDDSDSIENFKLNNLLKINFYKNKFYKFGKLFFY